MCVGPTGDVDSTHIDNMLIERGERKWRESMGPRVGPILGLARRERVWIPQWVPLMMWHDVASPKYSLKQEK